MYYLAETNLLTNGTFDANVTGWSSGRSAVLTWNSGRMQIDGASLSNPTAWQELTLDTTKQYLLLAEIISSSSANISLQFRSTNSGLGGTIFAGVTPGTGLGVWGVAFRPSQAQNFAHINLANASPATAIVDNVGVFEILSGSAPAGGGSLINSNVLIKPGW